jgi:hypothetical protein
MRFKKLIFFFAKLINFFLKKVKVIKQFSYQKLILEKEFLHFCRSEDNFNSIKVSNNKLKNKKLFKKYSPNIL